MRVSIVLPNLLGRFALFRINDCAYDFVYMSMLVLLCRKSWVISFSECVSLLVSLDDYLYSCSLLIMEFFGCFKWSLSMFLMNMCKLYKFKKEFKKIFIFFGESR